MTTLLAICCKFYAKGRNLASLLHKVRLAASKWRRLFSIATIMLRLGIQLNYVYARGRVECFDCNCNLLKCILFDNEL